MRRKSERVKSSPSVKQPESVTRRTTRRNKKSPEKSITEEESDNTSDQASHSDSDAEEKLATTKRGRRTAKVTAEKEKAPRSRRRAVNKKADEEQVANVAVPIEASVSASTNDNVTAQNSAVDVESSPEPIDGVPADEKIADHKDNGSISVDHDRDGVSREEPSPTPESAIDNDAIEISFSVNETMIGMDGAEPESSQSNEDEKSATILTEKEQPNTADTGHDSEAIPEKETERSGHVSTTSDSVAEDSDAAASSNKDVLEMSANDTTVYKEENAEVPATDKGDTRQNDNADAKPKEKRAENASGQTNNKSKSSPRKSSVLNANKENEATTKKPIVRKRKWLSSKTATSKVQEIAISTDSLKGLISDVKPVPLADVDLDSSPEPDHESDDVKMVSSTSIDYSRNSVERTHDESPTVDETPSAKPAPNVARKVSIVPDIEEPRPPSPAKHSPCNILFITNLVRPFTVLQLKGLLQRTGKIVENGFWMDKIKSKCFVQYETEE